MKVKHPMYRKILAIIVLILAIALFLIGTVRSYKVYDREEVQTGIDAFYRVNERDLVVDATFTGVVREGDKLYSTYDRSQPVGRRACPT